MRRCSASAGRSGDEGGHSALGKQRTQRCRAAPARASGRGGASILPVLDFEQLMAARAECQRMRRLVERAACAWMHERFPVRVASIVAAYQPPRAQVVGPRKTAGKRKRTEDDGAIDAASSSALSSAGVLPAPVVSYAAGDAQWMLQWARRVQWDVDELIEFTVPLFRPCAGGRCAALVRPTSSHGSGSAKLRLALLPSGQAATGLP